MRLVAILALIFANSGLTAADDQGIQDTWDRAEIWIHPKPFGFCNGRLSDPQVQSVLRQLPAVSKLATVIYLHGCGFRKAAGWTLARWLVKAGYAFIMPDSFARAGRPETCNNWTHERLPGAPGEAVYRMRQEEIQNAVEQVRALPWVDTENLFFMGHDEGGDAVAEYPGGGLRARVISGSAPAACELRPALRSSPWPPSKTPGWRPILPIPALARRRRVRRPWFPRSCLATCTTCRRHPTDARRL